MKKEYIVPVVEIVNVRLFGSVMEEVPIGRPSQVGTSMDAKETAFDDFDTEEDIWGGNSIQMKDVWER